jgi:hypothetical protein
VRPERFSEGLVRIGLAVRQAPDAATIGVYFDSIGHQVDEDEWDRFARWAVDVDRFTTFFPKLAELRDALREFRGARPLEVEAGAAYERVCAAGVYAPLGGTTWTYRAVAAACGRAAADAFLAAGGSAAFETTWNESKRREVFLREYIDAARAEPAARLLPAAPEGKALPPAEGDREPTATEARDLVRAIARRSASGGGPSAAG